jgi:Carbohydrate-selective porin, OprB family
MCKLPVIRLLFWPRNWLCILLLGAATALGLMVFSSVARGQAQGGTSVGALSYPQYPDDPNDMDQIHMPGGVEEDLKTSFAQPGAIFPYLQIPGYLSYDRFKVNTYERYGLRFAFSFSMLYQHASDTLPGASFDSALGGWAALETLWSPLDRDGAHEGSLVIRLGWRNSIGDNEVPALFGVTQLGSIWSNYEFTTWGDKVVVEDVFWQQWLGRRLRLRLGNQIPTGVLNFSRFKDARVSFTSSPFAFHETIPYPTFGLGVSFRWLPIQGSELYVNGTMNDMNGEPKDSGLDWSTFGEGQYFYGTEIGYFWRRANGAFDHLHLDLFYASKRSTRSPNILPNEPGGGFRIYGEKQIGSFVGFGGYTYNTAEGGGIAATFAQQTSTAGLAYLNPLKIQGEAALGLMWSQPIKNIFPGSGQRDQSGFEIYWRLQVTPILTVTPGLQVVIDPSFNPTQNVEVIPSIKFRTVF